MIKAKRDELLAPLAAVSGIIERRHTLPILSNVLIDTGGENVSFLATDIEIQIAARSGLGGSRDSRAFTVGARKLLDMLGGRGLTLHAAGSKLLDDPSCWLDLVRPGMALYRGATAFVYPSIAEGFGLPVLEAMACGCPVVTTTGSAPQEVGGEAVELVPARDPAELTAAMSRMLDPDHREDLRRKGVERAGHYSWARTAEGTLRTYRRALDAAG